MWSLNMELWEIFEKEKNPPDTYGTVENNAVSLP